MSETKLMALREAVNLAMSEEMRKDEKIFLMGEDVGVYGGDFGTSVGMLEEFGAKRVKDTPISEAAIAGSAVGAAITGLRPIVDLTFMDFITIALDAIVNNGAKNNYMFGGGLKTPVTFRVASGSGIGSAAQHSQSSVKTPGGRTGGSFGAWYMLGGEGLSFSFKSVQCSSVTVYYTPAW